MGNWNTGAWEQQDLNDSETEEEGKKRRMNVERSIADKKKISPVQSLCRAQSRLSLTTVRLEILLTLLSEITTEHRLVISRWHIEPMTEHRLVISRWHIVPMTEHRLVNVKAK